MIGETGIYIRLTVGELEGLVRERLGDYIEWMEFDSLLEFEEHMSLLKLRYSSYEALITSGIENFNQVFNEHDVEEDETDENGYSISLTFNQLKPFLEELLSQQIGTTFRLTGIEDVQKDNQERLVFLGTH